MKIIFKLLLVLLLILNIFGEARAAAAGAAAVSLKRARLDDDPSFSVVPVPPGGSLPSLPAPSAVSLSNGNPLRDLLTKLDKVSDTDALNSLYQSFSSTLAPFKAQVDQIFMARRTYLDERKIFEEFADTQQGKFITGASLPFLPSPLAAAETKGTVAPAAAPAAAAAGVASTSLGASGLLPAGEEEQGWRWRNSLNFSYKGFDPRTVRFDVDNFHAMMRGHEDHIYNQPELKGTPLNVLIPAISIIVQTTEGWRIVGDYFDSQYYTSSAIGPAIPLSSSLASSIISRPMVFISGMLNGAQSNIKRLTNYEFIDESYFGGEVNIKTQLSKLLSPDLLTKINTDPGAYKHTEQFLHFFLSNPEKMTQLIAGILEKNHIPRDAIIHEIILHVHSRLDLCSVCARSLFWMCRENIGELIIQPLLSKGFQGPEPSRPDRGIQFLLLASSREPYLGDDSRARGKDGRENIMIDAASFPPAFAVRALR